MEHLFLKALRGWANLNMALHHEAEKKYREEQKPEAAALAQGKYEAFYQMTQMLKEEPKND